MFRHPFPGGRPHGAQTSAPAWPPHGPGRRSHSQEVAMRKLVVMVVTLLAVASVSSAQTSGKVSTVWKCTAPSPSHVLPVGDAPDHIYVVQQTKCTATSG